MLGKLRAAVAARRDPSLVILGRTSSLRRGGIAEAEKRLKAYQDTGIDGIFLAGAGTTCRGRGHAPGHAAPPAPGRGHR